MILPIFALKFRGIIWIGVIKIAATALFIYWLQIYNANIYTYILFGNSYTVLYYNQKVSKLRIHSFSSSKTNFSIISLQM